MPKLIDHEARRDAYGEAVWRVIARDGLSAVSVRSVAAEAGVSAGSLRHLFPSRSDFLEYALELSVERATQRIAARISLGGDPLDLAIDVLEELLPIDSARRHELLTQLALVAAAAPGLAAIRLRAHREVYRCCVFVLERLAAGGLLPASPDPREHAATLHTILDGLALHLLEARAEDAADEARAGLIRSLTLLGVRQPGVRQGE